MSDSPSAAVSAAGSAPATSSRAAGGCQCGAVRYTAAIPAEGYWCHCRMCQRAFGSVAAAMVNVARADVGWTRGEPAYYTSSPIARRGFCAACGTPLTFDYVDGDNMDLSVGSLDDPAAVRLASHFGVESWVAGWIPHDGRPETSSEAHAPLVARWAAAGQRPTASSATGQESTGQESTGQESTGQESTGQ